MVEFFNLAWAPDDEGKLKWRRKEETIMVIRDKTKEPRFVLSFVVIVLFSCRLHRIFPHHLVSELVLCFWVDFPVNHLPSWQQKQIEVDAII